MTDKAREEFNRLAESMGYSARMSDGVYVFAETQRAWRIFKSQSARMAELERQKACDEHAISVLESDRIAMESQRDDLQAICRELVEALQQIVRWDGFPDSGKLWSHGGKMSYGAAFGSNGERDFMRDIAQQAISKTEGKL